MNRDLPDGSQSDTIRQLERLVEERDKQLAERDTQLAERDTQLAERDKQLAEKAKQLAERDTLIAKLTAEVEALKEELNKNSSNSGKPPSTDTPKEREVRQKRKRRSQRKRGAQKGHKGHHRQLLPPEQVDHILDCYPENCGCGEEPPPDSVKVVRHQVFEIPPITPEVTEYRLHSVTDSNGKTHQAKLPEGVSESPFGPRLVALICLLTGLYRLSKRQTAHLMESILGVAISIGAICRCEKRMSGVLAKPADELLEHAREQSVKHSDATSWRESGLRRQLWTIATTLVTVFAVTLNGTMETVKKLLGAPKGILVSDRARVFLFWPAKCRQVCWAHLIRMFVKFTERPGASTRIGEELLACTDLLFQLWHRVQDGNLKRSTFRQYSYGIRKDVRKLLEEGERCKHKKTAGSCKELLKLFDSMWTFTRVEGVEPTNNHAEQEIRHLVMWRRTSFGTQSESGSFYIARMASVVATLRKQERDVLEYLTEANRASLAGGPIPSLLPN